jgi:hypothetical protein
MECYSDWKPWDMVSGVCLDCGFTTQTITRLSSLAEVNAERVNMEMEPITALRKPTSEWLDGGYENFRKGRKWLERVSVVAGRFLYWRDRLWACWANRRYVNKLEFEEILRGN